MQQINLKNKEIYSFQPTTIKVAPIQMNQTEAQGSETKYHPLPLSHSQDHPHGGSHLLVRHAPYQQD
jgi:hypothetical protein